MREENLSNDSALSQVLRIVSDMAARQAEEQQSTAAYRRNNDRLIESHKLAIQKNGEAIDCMKDHFLKFEEKFDKDYKPMLNSDLERRRWWNGIYEEQKKRSVLVVTGVIAVAAMFGLGNAMLFMVKKFGEFMRMASL